MTGVRGRERYGEIWDSDTQEHRREGHVKAEAEIGVTDVQAKEHQGLPAVIRS